MKKYSDEEKEKIAQNVLYYGANGIFTLTSLVSGVVEFTKDCYREAQEAMELEDRKEINIFSYDFDEDF